PYVKSLRFNAADSVLEVGLTAIPSAIGKMDLLGSLSYFYEVNYQPDRVVRLLQRAEALDTAGENYRVYEGLARSFNQKREYNKAQDYALKALSQEPDHLPTLRQLFCSYLRNGKPEEAFQVAGKLVETYPRNFLAYLDLIEWYVSAARYVEADSVAQSALANDVLLSAQASVYWHLGNFYRRAGELERAERALQKAIRLYPEHIGAILSLGFLYELQGDYDQAAQDYRTAVDKRPLHVHGYLHLGQLYLRQEQLRESEQWLNQAYQIDDAYPSTLRSLGYLCDKQERSDEAYQFAKRALKIDSSYFSYNLMAWLLIEAQIDREFGLEMARRAMENPPPDDDYVQG
ncbi:MAG: tetratricopeptide repeat protein, partial [Candidatus Hydrogenedentota bacterium]